MYVLDPLDALAMGHTSRYARALRNRLAFVKQKIEDDSLPPAGMTGTLNDRRGESSQFC